METSKHIFAKVTLALAFLLLVSPFIGLLSSTATTVNISGASVSEHVDPVTGAPYGDVMQYDWPLSGCDSGNTRFNPGPAPNRPEILWTRSGASGGPVTAFDGKIFTYSGSTLRALNPFNGSVIWSRSMSGGTPVGFTSGSVFKLDDTYIGIITSNGVAFHRIDNGTFVSSKTLTAADGLTGGFSSGQVLYWGGFFDFENKMAYAATRNATTNQHMAIAINCSDPVAGATVAWTYGVPTGIEALGSGGGLAFFGGYGEGEIYAINAITGELAWKSWKIGNAGYSLTYYDGKVYHTASSTRVTCYDAEDGTILWDKDQGGRAFFAYGGAAAYGMYFDKSIALPGYVAAWDAETGDMLWKKPAHYSISYATPAVADGKVYVHTCDQAAGQTVGGIVSPGSSFTCFDAFTGEVIWTIPYDISLPMVAYGNLYGISGGTLYCIGENTEPWNSFHGRLGDHGVAVRQYAPSDISYPKWTYETEGPITGSPVAADGKVYFGSHDQNIYCLDAEDGSFIWKFPTGYRVASTPTVVDGKVYTGADDGNIYCINATTGEEEWTAPAGGLQAATLFSSMAQIRSSPTVVNNRLYVGAMDGNLYCLDTADGSEEWKYAVSTTAYGIGGSPCVSEGVVYIASGDGKLYALDATAGTLLWSATLTPTTRYMTGTPIVIENMDMLITPAHTGGFFGGQAMRGYNTTDGSMLWQVLLDLQGTFSTTPAVFCPTYHGGIIYASEGMYASAWRIVNPTTVERSWGVFTGRQVYTSLIYANSIDGGRLYFGSDVYSVTVLDATDGSALSAYTTQGQTYGAVAIYEGRVYFGSYDFNLYCFEDTHEVFTDIWATSSKGAKMFTNETVEISGGLRTLVTYTDEGVTYTDGRVTPTIIEDYYPPIPNAEVQVTFTKPDGTMVNETATTDSMGLFKLSYTPDVAGDYTWMAWYKGKKLPQISYTYAYSDWNSLEVVTPGGPTEPEEAGIPIEYVYAAVAVIAIVIIVIVGYLYMKRGKK